MGMCPVSFLLSVSNNLTLRVQNIDGFDACKPVYLHLHPACSGVLNMGQAVKNVCMHNVREKAEAAISSLAECRYCHTQRFHLQEEFLIIQGECVCVQGPDAHLKWIKPN